MSATTTDDYFVPTDGNEFSGQARVQESWFEYDEDNDRVVLKLELYSEDPDVGETIKQYGCGGGWQVEDDGARITHSSGKAKKFHVKSGVGTLLKSCNTHGIDLRERGFTPFEAGLWKGLDAEWDTVVDEFDIDGEIITRSCAVPVALNGNGAATKAPAAKKPAAKKEAAAPASTGINGALRGKLLALAKSCESHDEFMEKAFSTVDGVVGDTDAEAAVMDEAGIYADAYA